MLRESYCNLSEVFCILCLRTSLLSSAYNLVEFVGSIEDIPIFEQELIMKF